MERHTVHRFRQVIFSLGLLSPFLSTLDLPPKSTLTLTIEYSCRQTINGNCWFDPAIAFVHISVAGNGLYEQLQRNDRSSPQYSGNNVLFIGYYVFTWYTKWAEIWARQLTQRDLTAGRTRGNEVRVRRAPLFKKRCLRKGRCRRY